MIEKKKDGYVLDTQNLIFRRRRSQKFKKQTEVQNIIEKLKKNNYVLERNLIHIWCKTGCIGKNVKMLKEIYFLKVFSKVRRV